jgi:hypothetical protein
MKIEIEPFDFVGKEKTRILRIHLESFSYVRVTHRARREWQLFSIRRK